MSGPSFIMDVDDVQIAILDENIKTTNEASTQIASQLAMLARINKQAVYSVNPLMNKIYDLKLRQKNLHAIDDKVREVKSYASRVRQLLDMLDLNNNSLNGATNIQRYMQALDNLDNVDYELKNQGLGGFDGLKESIGEGILDGELALKATLLDKVKEIGELQISTKGSNAKAINMNIQDIRIIYKYLTDKRQMMLDDTIIRERVSFIKKELIKIKPVKPVVNKDQNYIYDGAKVGNFPDYTNLVKTVISREISLTTELFQGLVESLPRILTKISRPINDAYIYELNGMIEFIEMKRLSYNTMYYEIAVGANDMVSWMFERKLEPSDTLQQLSMRCANEAKNTFGDFFEYIKNRYNEMIVTDGVETLNNTFMLIATRMYKLSMFNTYQLNFISSMVINEWLPASLPNGFISEKATSSDPQFLLGTFYSDIIEYSFYSLANKFNGKRNEEDIGIMLLFNLDGLQNLLDGKSILKQIIGKRGVERYDRIKKKAMDKAVSSWSMLTAKIMTASTKQGEQLSMGNKELAKFIDEFNAKLDEQCNGFKKKEMPVFFRKQMISDITKTLVPSYKIFYAHVSVNGGKSVVKHLVYTPEELGAKLSRLG